MFNTGEIWAYPTDTSFGLGVRADDSVGLERLMDLKSRAPEKYFSLMVRDFKMLQQFAEVPPGITESVFFASPKTLILKPKSSLPKSRFWPDDKVAFRVCTRPEIMPHINFPITATSANISGKAPIYNCEELKNQFGIEVKICQTHKALPVVAPSEIWDLTDVTKPQRIR